MGRHFFDTSPREDGIERGSCGRDAILAIHRLIAMVKRLNRIVNTPWSKFARSPINRIREQTSPRNIPLCDHLPHGRQNSFATVPAGSAGQLA
jgi:hypothetical protein